MSKYPKFTQKCYCEETLDCLIDTLKEIKEKVLKKKEGEDFSFFNRTLLEALKVNLRVIEYFVDDYMETKPQRLLQDVEVIKNIKERLLKLELTNEYEKKGETDDS